MMNNDNSEKKTERTPLQCSNCNSPISEFWNGSHGLKGLRCKNKCFSSYIIFTERAVVTGFPKEEEIEKKHYKKHDRKN